MDGEPENRGVGLFVFSPQNVVAVAVNAVYQAVFYLEGIFEGQQAPSENCTEVW